jgi:hypothetical protein
MEKFPDETIGIVGRCIYCGTTTGPLSDEHIVPYGLNGPWVLRAASCQTCAAVTSAFEMEVLRNGLIIPRTSLGMPTRRKKDRPQTFPLGIVQPNGVSYIDAPVSDYPALILLPKFPLPAFPDAGDYKEGIEVVDHVGIPVAGPTGEELLRIYKTRELQVRLSYHPVAFARMIAKIAYGFTVAAVHGDLSQIEETYVLPAILGQANDIGRWVGCGDESSSVPWNQTHSVRFTVENGVVYVYVRLFAYLNTPGYLVVVGRIAKRNMAEMLAGGLPLGVGQY